MLVVIFILLLFFICHFFSFTFSFRHHPSPFRGLSPSFYNHFVLSAQLIAEWLATLSFSTIPLSSYRERYGFEWAFSTHRRFLPGSRQLFLKICRTSYWSSKHRLGPSVCLIHSNPQSFIRLKFVFTRVNIAKVLLVVKTLKKNIDQ